MLCILTSFSIQEIHFPLQEKFDIEVFIVSRNPCVPENSTWENLISKYAKKCVYSISSYLNQLESIQLGCYPLTYDDDDKTTTGEGLDEDEGVEKGEQEGPGPLGFHDLGCIGRCGRTYARTSARMPHTTPCRCSRREE